MFAIESKFTEWLKPKTTSKPPFKEKYFEMEGGLWHHAGLPKCPHLAQDVQAGAERFVHLDAPQLLKHALGLAKQTGQDFSLCYLYFDWPCSESEIHRREVSRFEDCVKSEIRFRSMTYQELFCRLTETCGPEHTNYLGYLRKRYFGSDVRSEPEMI